MATYKLEVKMPQSSDGEQAKTVEFYVTADCDLERQETPEGASALGMIALEKVLQHDHFPRTRDYGFYRSRVCGAATRFTEELCLSEGPAPQDAPRFGVGYARVAAVPQDAWRVAYADRMMEMIEGRCDYLPMFNAMRKKEKIAFWDELMLVGDELLTNPDNFVIGATDSGISRNVLRRILQYEIVCRVPGSDRALMRKQLLASSNPSLLEICYGADTLFVATPQK